MKKILILGKKSALKRLITLLLVKLSDLTEAACKSINVGRITLFNRATGKQIDGAILEFLCYRFSLFTVNEDKLEYKRDIGFCFYHELNQFRDYLRTKRMDATDDQIRGAIERIRDKGFVDFFRKRNSSGKTVRHFILNFGAISRAIIKTAIAFIKPNTLFNYQPIEDLDEWCDRPQESVIEVNCDKKSIIKPFLRIKPKEKPMKDVEVRDNSDRREVKTDRYFGQQRNQLAEIREKAIGRSAVGMSGLKDADDLCRCQEELTRLYCKSMASEKAATTAKWEVIQATQGIISVNIKDYLRGLPVGTSLMEEWHVAPGVVAPIFLRFLRCELKKKDDTYLKSVQNVTWVLNKPEMLPMMWAECKRQIVIQESRYEKAIASGLSPKDISFPEWLIESYRDDVSVDKAASVVATIESSVTESIQSDAIALKRFEDHLSGKNLIVESNYFLPATKTEIKDPVVSEQPKKGIVFTDLYRSLGPTDKERWTVVYKEQLTLGKDPLLTDAKFQQRKQDLESAIAAASQLGLLGDPSDITPEPEEEFCFEITDAIASDINQSLKKYF